MFETWDSSERRRVKLAHEALEISEDCTDAYVLLAEETARSLEEARSFYEKGVMAGEKALGPQMFRENVDHFGGNFGNPSSRAGAGGRLSPMLVDAWEAAGGH